MRETRITAAPAVRLGQYAKHESKADEGEIFVVPENLGELSDSDLEQLATDASANFDTIFGDGTNPSEEDLAALAALTEGIEAIQAELASRQSAASERAAAAAELASRVRPELAAETETQADDTDATLAADETGTDVAETEEDSSEEEDAAPAAQAVVAATASPVAPARREIRIPVASGRRPAPRGRGNVKDDIRSVLTVSGDGHSRPSGTGVTFEELGAVLERQLAGFNEGAFEAAARAGRAIRQQKALATFTRQVPADLIIRSSDIDHVNEVLRRAIDETRLPKGSLIASGGWMAPSEIIYTLQDEPESRDGLFSIPTIGVTRGGIRRTLGPDFATLFANYPSWVYTESQDTAGTYAINSTTGIGTGSAGNKPVYTIPAVTFDEFRLKLTGIAVSAGLTQARGYPELIARFIRGLLVAHDHRMAGRVLADIETGSTVVRMAGPQQGAAAPILDAIELQVEHARNARRRSRAETFEAVFPFWVRGAIRKDLARRNGVSDFMAVTDAQISAWFASRGVAAQFVYNWDDFGATTAANMIQWPSTVKFLLYPAGTWVMGNSDVVSIETLYDSVGLGQNNYTALFTEAGYFVAPMGRESRVVTVPIQSDGTASSTVYFDNMGATESAPSAGTTTTTTTAG